MKHVSPPEFTLTEPAANQLDSITTGALQCIFDVEFPQNASLTLKGPEAPVDQQLAQAIEVDPLLCVSGTAEIAVPCGDVDPPSLGVRQSVKKTKGKGPGRPKKRGRKKAKGPDKRKRVMEGPIKMAQRRDMLDAVLFGRYLRKEPNTTINFQPVHLGTYPEGQDMGRWFRNGILKAVATFFARKKDGQGRPLKWYGFATRESYVGYRREHLHIVLWCPLPLRTKLLDFLRHRFPGGIEEGRMAVHVGDLKEDGGIEYRLKQMEGNAAGELRPDRPVAETHSRWDGAAVASVFGKRYVISRTLDLKARSADGWQQRRDEARALRRLQDAARRARNRGDYASAAA